MASPHVAGTVALMLQAHPGMSYDEVRSALYPLKDRPTVVNFIGGLGGRDISIDDCRHMFEVTMGARDGKVEDATVTWIGLRE